MSNIEQFIPAGILTWIGGVAVTAITAIIAHRAKSIPFKILIGTGSKNGKHYITQEELRENCELRQGMLDKSLQEIINGQKETQKSIGDVREKIAFIEGKVSMRRT
jgi:hypothetical protein